MSPLLRAKKALNPEDIREALTIKHDDVFVLSDHHGDMPKGNLSALGLYYRDTRFLSRYELRVDGMKPTFLHAKEDRNYSMVVETTLPIQALDPGGRVIKKNVSLLRRRWIERGMREQVTIHNFGLTDRWLAVELRFEADFLDLFEVRGFRRERSGTGPAAAIDEQSVTLSIEGQDGTRRALRLRFDPAPRTMTKDRARFKLKVDSGDSASIDIHAIVRIGEEEPDGAGIDALAAEYTSWRKRSTRFTASNRDLQRSLDRAVLDLKMMQGDAGGIPMLQAGVPWFATLFGRDALITAYQTLWVNPDLAKWALELLAQYQADADDAWRDAEPGKILHEPGSTSLSDARTA